jgi:hypothetical protein
LIEGPFANRASICPPCGVRLMAPDTDGESVLRFRIPLLPPVAPHQMFSAGSPERKNFNKHRY